MKRFVVLSLAGLIWIVGCDGDHPCPQCPEDPCPDWQQLPMTGYTHSTGKNLAPQACEQGYVYATAGISSEGATDGTPIEVWRFDGASWTLINNAGFGDVNNILIDSAPLTIYRDSVYVATDNNVTGVEVWRHYGSDGWRQVNPDGFSDGPGTKSCGANGMAVYEDKLYVVTTRCPYNGIAVWRYDGSNWEDTGFDDGGRNELGGTPIVYNGLLYMGTYYKGAGGEMWAYDGSAWTAVLTGGIDDSGNYNIIPAVVYDGALMIGTTNETTGGEIWRYSDDGFRMLLTQINSDGFGDKNNIVAMPSGVRSAELFVVAYNEVTGHQVWTWDGAQWSRERACPILIEPGFPSGSVQCGQSLYIAVNGQLWK
jgi:hypothetical protein